MVQPTSLSVFPSETVAVVGKSGSGKTTLLSMLGLLSRPDSGTVTIDGCLGSQLGQSAMARLRNKSIGFVFQGYSLVPHLSAAENVELPLIYSGMPASERRAIVGRLIDDVGLGGRARSRPRELSGGEQQRVAIARALARRPNVILADEPTGALDTRTGRLILDLLYGIVRTTDAAMMIVTHDEEVAEHADRRLTMRAGCIETPISGGSAL